MTYAKEQIINAVKEQLKGQQTFSANGVMQILESALKHIPSSEPDLVDCDKCEGAGWYPDMGCCNSPTPNGGCCGDAIQIQTECEVCNGSGKIEKSIPSLPDDVEDEEWAWL